ncbi:hypothetical protein sscle_09g071090 [Sclerotinia sclerotiorum 1980 UF-70]|uniref:Uncharacterized protein n=1 Tax=Sclerotinia sclerotiorum (strain ATCC 18683 / 1980 / Ss-1) TaxID=665079 RepID=A0A1D9QBT0_SCLS1|nr:hypothetical protein sscle_09g071090 [Sclerotinia sclerotiorum 1980 UF-70]
MRLWYWGTLPLIVGYARRERSFIVPLSHASLHYVFLSIDIKPLTMSLKSIPIEALQLVTILREKVLVKWVNAEGTASTLGSRLSHNRQRPELLMTASYDKEGHIHIDFSLMLAVKMGGKFKQIEIMFVIPPNVNPALLETSSRNSVLDASALHDADISDELGHVISIPFNLTTKGFVIMKNTNSLIRLQTSTSEQLIRNIESLSNTAVFDVYIRPSDYARESLKELCKRLGDTGIVTPRPSTLEMYAQQGSMLVEWNRFTYKDRQLFPQHPPTPAQHPLEMSLPQEPQVALDGGGGPLNTVEQEIATRQNRIEQRSNGEPVLGASITWSDVELSDVDVDLHDFEQSSNLVEMDVNICSDEEILANEQLRDLNLQLRHEMLRAKLVKWINGSLRLHPDVFRHRGLVNKLAILGDCVRRSNARTFDHTISWCSALLFYDPSDSSDDQLWEERNRWLITRMANMINWINKYHYGAEFSSALFDHFVKLGRVARAFALGPGRDDTEFRHQRSVCIGWILSEFDGLGGERTGRGRGMTGSRKRNALEARGNISKRGRNTM